MGLIRALIGIVVTILIAGFAALNRERVPVTWNPLEFDVTLELPLYAIILACTVFGFVIGGFSVWVNLSGVRKERRRQKKEIKILEKEVAKLRDDKFQPKPHMPAPDMFQALPPQ